MELPRSSGILLHPTSLPGPHGLGSLGIEAYRFVEFLAAAGQSVWQILPLGPTGYGDSPYSAFSAFAGNPLLVCLERLVEVGDLSEEDLAGHFLPEGETNYGFAHGFKERLLHKAAIRFRAGEADGRHASFDAFCAEQGYWLHDYALFRSLRRHFEELSWNRWPTKLRHRDPQALEEWSETLADSIYCQKYAQFAFFEQWFALKEFANAKGVRIMGDIPIFIAFDSADVWANPDLFYLDEQGDPTLVSGVPPDYFSATGQRWGNPLYRWEAMAEDDYSWWIARFRWNLAQTDLVRIDHFRGFEAYWAVPAEEETAVKGTWQPGPRVKFFHALGEALGEMPIVAEDLGLITEEVRELRDTLGIPGMKVLQFAFDSGPDNPYLPHNIPRNCVIYTGTHDNDTTVGWWEGLDKGQQKHVRRYLGPGEGAIHHDLVRLALASVADLALFPLQDLLGLDSSARMNIPGQDRGNWGWRLRPGELTESLAEEMRNLCRIYGRTKEVTQH